jgi:hypothetical protein
MLIGLLLSSSAVAAPCVFNGNRGDFLQCIATQSATNEADISVLDDAVFDLDLRVAAVEVGTAVVAGFGLRPDRVGNTLGGLGNGAAYAEDLGDVFSLAPIQVPDGAILGDFSCTLKDEDGTGYIQALLLRADRNDPSVFSSDIVGSVGTFPATTSPNYTRLTSGVDATLAVVDNENFSYYLRVDFLDVTQTFANVALHSCGVSYAR